jgi:hypothetical protein
MSNRHESTTPPDVSLLLRAHAEQRWLSREVIPVLRQIETRERLPEEQLPAALAYLEVIWCEARRRARETDTARAHLPESGAPPGEPFPSTGSGEGGAEGNAESSAEGGAKGSVEGNAESSAEGSAEGSELTRKAHGYHAAVLVLREAVRGRVLPLLAAPTTMDAQAGVRF